MVCCGLINKHTHTHNKPRLINIKIVELILWLYINGYIKNEKQISLERNGYSRKRNLGNGNKIFRFIYRMYSIYSIHLRYLYIQDN